MLLKGRRPDHPFDQYAELATALGNVVDNQIHRVLVTVFYSSSERVREQLLGHAAVKLLSVPLTEDSLQLTDVRKTFAGDQFSRGINRIAAVLVTPLAKCIEVFQHKPNGSILA